VQVTRDLWANFTWRHCSYICNLPVSFIYFRSIFLVGGNPHMMHAYIYIICCYFVYPSRRGEFEMKSHGVRSANCRRMNHACDCNMLRRERNDSFKRFFANAFSATSEHWDSTIPSQWEKWDVRDDLRSDCKELQDDGSLLKYARMLHIIYTRSQGPIWRIYVSRIRFHNKRLISGI
jgi:hypothetical protein